MMKRFALILISTILLNATYSQTVNGVVISDTANIKVVQVWGNHYERGYAQGYLLANEIHDLYVNYVLAQVGSYMPLAKAMISGGTHVAIDNIYITEAQGMVDGMADAGIDTTGVNYLDLLVANSFLDLEGFPGIKTDMGNNCSAFMSWGSATINTPLLGKSVISRHLDWGPDPAIVDNQVIVAHVPSEANEQPWVMIGFAGQISALSGVNTNGIAAFQNMMSDFSGPAASFNQAYEPIWFAIRKSLETDDYNSDGTHDCNDVRDAINSNAQGYADGFIVSALASSTVVHDSLIALVAELAPLAPKITFRGNEYADSILNDNLYAANYEIKRNNHRHYCSRYMGVIDSIGAVGDKMSRYKNWGIMRDHSNAGWSNIQFMQFVPEDRYIDISVYRNGNAAYTMDSVRFWLDDLFDVPAKLGKSAKVNSGIKVMPNPFSNSTVVCFEGKQDEIFDMYLFDLNGKQVRMENSISSRSFSVNRKNLKKGVYLITLTGNKGTKLQGNVIIN